MRWVVLWFFFSFSTASGVDVATGERFEYPDREFAIVPPPGFEVHENIGGIFLNFREKHRRGLRYQRNIQVFWNNGYHYIDEAAAEKLAADIGVKFSKFNSHIKDYRVSRYTIVDIGERKGILFYNNYAIDKSEMMHIVMLVSSSKEHYLVTYTDLLKNYRKHEGDEAYTDVWWNCFTSIELPGSPPDRYRYYIVGGGALAIILFLFTPFYLFRRTRSAKYYDSFAYESISQQDMVEVIDDSAQPDEEVSIDDDDYDYDSDNDSSHKL